MEPSPVELNSVLTNLPQYPFAQLATLRKSLVDRGIKLFDFSKGDPIEPTPPFIVEALRRSIPAVSQYPSVKGLPELREAIARYITRRFGVTLDAERQIIQSNGSKEAIYHLPPVLIGAHSRRNIVIASAPGYMVVERGALFQGASYYPVQLSTSNGFLLDLAEVPESVLARCAIAWLNYPHNPTGMSCDLAYLKRQVEIARKFGILLCSDECYVDLYLGANPHPSILQVTTQGVLAFHSCSKRSGMTGYRSGFVAGDATVLKTYLALRDAIGTETSIFVQHAASAAWNDDAHVEVRRAAFRQKRKVMTEFFDRQGIQYAPNDASFYLWIKVPNGTSGRAYAAKLAEHGILVVPGDFFGGEDSAHVRVALVPLLAECIEATKVWEQVEN